MAFGSENSTSGRLMPQYFMGQTVKPRISLWWPGIQRCHDATIAVVQSGAYEVGALNEQVWNSNVESGRVDPDQVRVI